MKAVVVTNFGGPEYLSYQDIEVPKFNEDEVLIQVVKTSVNFADIKQRYGKKGGKLPFVPGLDAAGYVVEIGANVSNLTVGQRVIAFTKGGSYAEYAVASHKLVYPIPDELDFETAAACPIVSFLSYRLLHNIARIEEGESVLVHAAAGGVGTTATQLAKLMGASKVIGTVGHPDKIKTALENGADHVICYEQEDFAAKVNELTNGLGVDIILDSIAGAVTENSFNCLAPFGRLVHFGNSSGHVGNIKTVDLHASCRSVLGYSLGTTRQKRPELQRETAQKVIPYLVNKQLKIAVGHRFPLKDAASAHLLVENRLNKGKIILDVLN
ncbi:zinc-binding dehydrogenase [Bacillus sp. FJAT-29814]|uniref:quinone oxidoreductase family protein n=1 Tax=Bacillus sp. FJAT-29814 TaxID=1729688 RepID=UPI00082D78FD|nr:zinc-binding dehydrogenase [Bacillus sp. FJAT-29814]